ncbi:MAG: DUF5658 family protein [Sulfolobales archaeon]|nr:DUF5658 family protein [Sulfolobales archaeon]
MILKLSALLSILNVVDAVLTKIGLDREIVYETNAYVISLHRQGVLLPIKFLMSAVVLGLGLGFYYLTRRLERKSVLVLEAAVAVVTAIVAGMYAFAVLNNVIYLMHWIWGFQ